MNLAIRRALTALFSCNRVLRLLALAFGVTLAPLAAQAYEFSMSKLVPTRVFVQAGFAENNTDAYVIGAIWDWNWRKQYSFGTFSGFADASFGRWKTDTGDTQASAWATQLGLTPVLRLHPAVFKNRLFVEAGIGANVILPIYRSRDKRFSTEFNFGDHIAVGTTWGQRTRHEIALRLQHFSNAGIDHPNPGENFLQVRYARRL